MSTENTTQSEVILVAFHLDATGTDTTFTREGAMNHVAMNLQRMNDVLRENLRGVDVSCWQAEDDRTDGSDNDSAVFVPMGAQTEVRAAIGEADWSDLEGASTDDVAAALVGAAEHLEPSTDTTFVYAVYHDGEGVDGGDVEDVLDNEGFEVIDSEVAPLNDGDEHRVVKVTITIPKANTVERGVDGTRTCIGDLIYDLPYVCGITWL
jgi:hypothetical protein